MLVLDAKTQRAMKNLSGDSNFEAVLDLVERTLGDRTDDLLRANSTVHVHQMQGYVSALKDFMQAARPAKPLTAHLG